MDRIARKIRTRNFRDIELLVWLLIILACVIIGIFVHFLKLKSFEMHGMFLPDVDGVIVGSPVNMMGVRIGYVNKIKMVNDDEIYIRFIVKNKSVHIPKGTIATIESFGMGGSRTLELYPPDKKYTRDFGLDDSEYLVVQNARRLSDATSLLYEMFTKIGSIIYKFSYFSEQIKTSNIQNDSQSIKQDINYFVEFSEKWVDNIQKKVNDKNSNMNKNNRSEKDEY